jgi:DNA-binding FrmR family transcriptional regulator
MKNDKPNEVVSCGCGSTPETEGRKAVAVDADIKKSNLRRLRRIEGQVRGLQKVVEEERYCPDIMVQLSAVQEALRTVGRALMRNHLKHCTTHAVAHGSRDQVEAVYDELIELIYKHSR